MGGRRGWLRVSWVGLAVLGVFFLVAPVLDIVNTRAHGVPADHEGTFRRLSGGDFAGVRGSTPGVAHYVSTLEYGYALHELTFGLLFLAVVLVPLRRGERWAWFACWAALVAAAGYSATFGAHDSTILARSLVADVGVPVLLLVGAPGVFGVKTEV